MFRALCALFLLGFLPNIDALGLCEAFEESAAINPNISTACLKQMTTVCNNPELVWKFYDASSKFLTSGMSYSNVIDYGNFPECLSIDHVDTVSGHIIGKFCGFSHVIVNVLLTTETEEILTGFGVNITSPRPHTISGKTFTELNLQLRDVLLPDIPYVLSKYSSCVPDACTPNEVGHFYWYAILLSDTFPLIMYTEDLLQQLGINITIPCETLNSNTDFEAGDIAVITFFAVIGALMLACTIYDAWCQNFQKEPHHPLLISFSVLYNGKKLLQTSTNSTEQIQVFNGMRFIGMMWIMAYHGKTVSEAGLLGLENYPAAKEWTASVYNSYINSAQVAVDTFFFIAGFLLAFTYLKSNEESPLAQIKKVPKMYLHRYLRLTPSVAVMYLVTITFFRMMGAGPTWTAVTGLFSQVCKDRWWKFFLYIQNYTDPDDMCINPTWYLSADMQMFILAPLVLIPMATFIRKRFRAVLYSLIGLTVLSVLIPMLIRYFVNQAAGNIYTSHERFSDFLIGMTFGGVMRLYKHKPFIFSPAMNFLLWVVVMLVSLAFNLYWFDVLYNYELLKYTLFMGLYRPVWCLCLVFMVYSCYHNHGGIVQWFLSLPSFQILAKLSYSMYVLHVIVEIYAGGTIMTNSYFSNYMLFYQWCGHFIVTMILSVFWVLAFEFPMLTIDKYLLRDDRKPVKRGDNAK